MKKVAWNKIQKKGKRRLGKRRQSVTQVAFHYSFVAFFSPPRSLFLLTSCLFASTVFGSCSPEDLLPSFPVQSECSSPSLFLCVRSDDPKLFSHVPCIFPSSHHLALHTHACFYFYFERSVFVPFHLMSALFFLLSIK